MEWWSNHIDTAATGNFGLSSINKHLSVVNDC